MRNVPLIAPFGKSSLFFRPYHIVVHWSALLNLKFQAPEVFHIVVPPDMDFLKTLPPPNGPPVSADFPIREFFALKHRCQMCIGVVSFVKE